MCGSGFILATDTSKHHQLFELLLAVDIDLISGLSVFAPSLLAVFLSRSRGDQLTVSRPAVLRTTVAAFK